MNAQIATKVKALSLEKPIAPSQGAAKEMDSCKTMLIKYRPVKSEPSVILNDYQISNII